MVGLTCSHFGKIIGLANRECMPLGLTNSVLEAARPRISAHKMLKNSSEDEDAKEVGWMEES